MGGGRNQNDRGTTQNKREEEKNYSKIKLNILIGSQVDILLTNQFSEVLSHYQVHR